MVLGLVLFGSHATGMADRNSDYDILCILTEDGYARREADGLSTVETERAGAKKLIEIVYSSPHRLGDPSTPRWFIQGLAGARVLLDRTGEIKELLDRLITLPEDEARKGAADMFDGYLNCFYRSMKAAQRRNELGARLEATESLAYLVRTLFALERRYPPFHTGLDRGLDALDGQGWKPGELRDHFLAIARTADPRSQADLEKRVERLMRERGYAHVVEAWDGEIERVKRISSKSPGEPE